MKDINELRERAKTLSQQIGLIRTAISTNDISGKTDTIEREVAELRQANSRLTYDNQELKECLTSLITSLENSRLSHLPDALQRIGRKLDGVIKTDRAGRFIEEKQTESEMAAAPDVARAPQEGRHQGAPAHEPERQVFASGLRRPSGPYVVEQSGASKSGTD